MRAGERVGYVRVRLINYLYPCTDGDFLGFFGWFGSVCWF